MFVTHKIDIDCSYTETLETTERQSEENFSVTKSRNKTILISIYKILS